MEYTSRDDVPPEYRCDFGHVYETQDEWESTYTAAKKRVSALLERDELAVDGAAELRAVLEEYEEVWRQVETLEQFAMVQYHTDNEDEDARRNYYLAKSLRKRLSEAAPSSFLSPDVLDGLALDDPATPNELGRFEYYLHTMVGKRADAPTENVLSTLDPVLSSPGDVYRAVVEEDFEPPTVTTPDGDERAVTRDERKAMLKRPDRSFRRRVQRRYFGALDDHRHVLASAWETKVERVVRVASLRGIESPAELLSSESPVGMGPEQSLPTAVCHELLDGVAANVDALRRYDEYRRDALGVDALHSWDRFVALEKGTPPTLSYADAKSHVLAALSRVGTEYRDVAEAVLEDRRIDVYETPEKDPGVPGYTFGSNDAGPLVVMHYRGNVGSLFMLAHELGHAIHWEFLRENQPAVYGSLPPLVQEVPAKFNELLVAEHLVREFEDDSRLTQLLRTTLGRIASNLWQSARWVDFDRRAVDAVDAGESLNPGTLDELCEEVHERYLPTIATDETVRKAWLDRYLPLSLSHEYPYLVGTVVAATMLDRLTTGEFDPASYRSFLEAGTSEPPVELLGRLDVDLMAGDPVERAAATYGNYLDAFLEVRGDGSEASSRPKQ